MATKEIPGALERFSRRWKARLYGKMSSLARVVSQGFSDGGFFSVRRHFELF